MAVTSTDVTRIYPTTVDLSGYIKTATIVVEDLLLDKGLPADVLDQITIYLAAHFATIGSGGGGLRSKKVGEATETYAVPAETGKGYQTTNFGQMAMLLDSSGTLASASSKTGLQAEFQVVSPYRTSA